MLLGVLYAGGYGAFLLGLLFSVVGGLSLAEIIGVDMAVGVLGAVLYLAALFGYAKRRLDNRFRAATAIGFSGLLIFGLGLLFFNTPLWHHQGFLCGIAQLYQALGFPQQGITGGRLDVDHAFQLVNGTFFFPVMALFSLVMTELMRRYEILKDGL